MRLRACALRDTPSRKFKPYSPYPKTGGGCGIVNPETNEAYSLTTICNDVHELEQFWLSEARRDVVEHRGRVLAELRAVILMAWGMVAEGKMYAGGKLILEALKQQRLVLGLDAPAKVQNYNLDIPLTELDDTEIKALAAGADPYEVLANHNRRKTEGLLDGVDLSGLDHDAGQGDQVGDDAE